jgi:hypothetical protein
VHFGDNGSTSVLVGGDGSTSVLSGGDGNISVHFMMTAQLYIS